MISSEILALLLVTTLAIVLKNFLNRSPSTEEAKQMILNSPYEITVIVAGFLAAKITGFDKSFQKFMITLLVMSFQAIAINYLTKQRYNWSYIMWFLMFFVIASSVVIFFQFIVYGGISQ